MEEKAGIVFPDWWHIAVKESEVILQGIAAITSLTFPVSLSGESQ